MHQKDQLRVVYIAGYGRSGSTVLDIALGEASDVFGCGEISTLTRHVWENDEYCACGATIRLCEVWRPVMARWTAGAPDRVDAYHRLQRRFESITSPLLFSGHAARSPAFVRYGEDTLALFRAIAAQSGRSILVDSSKLPLRALALARLPGIDLRVIHLVRDGRGVAWSLLQPFERDVRAGLQKEIRPKSAARTAVRWSIVNAVTEHVCRLIGPGRSVRVRYEDFTRDPAAEMTRMGAALGLDLSAAAAALDRGDPVRSGHQMAGNRGRMSGAVTLSQDVKWRSRMSAAQQASVRRIGGLMLRRYGYLPEESHGRV